MFFIIFVLFFSKYFQANALQCMSHEGGHLFSSAPPCKFELKINDPIPDDATLPSRVSECEMREANSLISLLIPDGSCYGEVSIDYDTKKMIVKLSHANGKNAFQDPYDDMFGFLNGIQSVVQYKINGNLDTGKIQMITRIQCKTYDNCALDKLRKLLRNVTIVEPRLNIFKELRMFLNTPDSTKVSPLTCMDNSNKEVQCENDANRCKYERNDKDCTTKYSNEDADLAYRFNVIEEIEDSDDDNSAAAFKISYLCNTKNCNSDNHFKKVDELLNAFAVVPSSNTNSGDTDNKRPQPQADQSNPGNRKSDGVSYFISFYSRSIIIFSLFVQILPN